MANYVAFVRDGDVFNVPTGQYEAFIRDEAVYHATKGTYLGFVRSGWIYSEGGSPIAFFSGDDLFEDRAGTWRSFVG